MAFLMKNFLWKIPEPIPENLHRSILLGDWPDLKFGLEHLRNTDRSTYVEVAEKLDYLLRDEVRFRWDFRYAAFHYFHIVNKSKETVLFNFNEIQDLLYRTVLDEPSICQYVLKSRKFGCSTFFLLLYYWDCLTGTNSTSVVIAHEYEPSERLFKIVSYANDNLDERFKRKASYDNRREIFFKKENCYFFVGSAQKQDFGRSDTINNLHFSEFAFWPDPESLLASLSESMPKGGNLIVETTPSPKPYYKQFHNDCKYKRNEFNYLFLPWFISKEYQSQLEDDTEVSYLENQLTDEERLMMKQYELSWEQIKFWLSKRSRLKSSVWQEYPPDDVSCFLSTGERDFFDTRNLHKIYLYVQNIKPIETRDNDQILIYSPPQYGRTYLIGADTSKGLLSGSRSAAVIIDVEASEEVAELKGIYSPHELGLRLAKLGEEYNWAMIAVEENNHGHSTLNTLKNQVYYPNLYYHIDSSYEDWLRKRSGIGKKIGQEGSLGWPTNSKTRPIMFQDLRNEVIDEFALVIKSKHFISESLALKEKDGEIYSDELFDTVIARAIAWQVRKRMKVGIGSMVSQIRRTEQKEQKEEPYPWLENQKKSEKIRIYLESKTNSEPLREYQNLFDMEPQESATRPLTVRKGSKQKHQRSGWEL